MKKQVGTYSLSIVVGAILWLLFLVMPQMRMKAENNNAINEADIRLAEMQKMMASFPREFSTSQEIKLEKAIDLSREYSREQLLELFDQMRRHAVAENLAVLEISPSVEELLALNRSLTQNKDLPQLNLTIRLNGSLRNLAGYIKNIESEKFYLGTNFCHIATPSSGQGYPDMSYSFRTILGLTRE
jgi:hypothetical protein